MISSKMECDVCGAMVTEEQGRVTYGSVELFIESKGSMTNPSNYKSQDVCPQCRIEINNVVTNYVKSRKPAE